MSPTLRLAIATDLADLMKLRRELYCHDAGSLDDERDREALKSLVCHPSIGRAWLIEIEFGVIGFAIVTFCYSIEFGGRFALVDELYISPSHRHRGYGAEVLKQIEQAMRSENILAMRLEVNRGNPDAERLYHRVGFAVDDRNLMTKWLKRG